jgi:hypothetical protein
MANLQIGVPPDVVRQPGLVSTSGVLVDLNAATSGALVSQISASTAGVGQLNGLSGVVNLVGTGGLTITTDGQNIVLSGGASGAGGGGEVSTAQLNSVSGWVTGVVMSSSNTGIYRIITGASGWLLNQPQINLVGGTGLVVNNIYTDGFNANRVLSFSGTPNNSSFISLFANVTNTSVINFPTSYRLGQFGATTGLVFPPGNHQITWTYSDSKWWLADTAGSINNFGDAVAPTAASDWTSGYGVGSQWINTGTNIAYICTDATSGAAEWYQFSPPTGAGGGGGDVTQGQLDSLSGWSASALNLQSTGSNLYNLIVNSSGQANTNYATKTELHNTGTLLSAVRVTGSSTVNAVNLTGLGGTLIVYSGDFVFVSGAAAGGGGGGVTTLTGDVTGFTNGSTMQVGVTSVGSLEYQTGGAFTFVNMPTSGMSNGAEASYSFNIANAPVFKIIGSAGSNGSVSGTYLEINGGPLLSYTGAVAQGTSSFVFTNASTGLPLTFTASPIVTLPFAGTWSITPVVQVGYSNATVNGESAVLKLHRENNTPVTITGCQTTINLMNGTGMNFTHGSFQLPTWRYQTLNANDILTIHANVSSTLTAGSVVAQPSGTYLVAERVN